MSASSSERPHRWDGSGVRHGPRRTLRIAAEHQEGMALQRFLDMMAPEGSSISLEDAIAAGHGPWRGSVEQLVDHVGQLRDLGLDEVVFEHFCHEDDTIPEWIAAEVKPRLEAF
ncbi:hypothetical protein [Candidatus Poriferisodalis sp.]|uniref:hypothetical protein n=1 Tax=Candidatus Poriferisodalis sp. TaxID=3101277 RepID=UPI003B528BBC